MKTAAAAVPGRVYMENGSEEDLNICICHVRRYKIYTKYGETTYFKLSLDVFLVLSPCVPTIVGV